MKNFLKQALSFLFPVCFPLLSPAADVTGFTPLAQLDFENPTNRFANASGSMSLVAPVTNAAFIVGPNGRFFVNDPILQEHPVFSLDVSTTGMPFTVTFKAQLGSIASSPLWGLVVTNADGRTFSFAFRRVSTNELAFASRGSENGPLTQIFAFQEDESGVDLDNGWMNYALVFTAGRVKFYRDGEYVAYGSTSLAASAQPSRLCLGARADGNDSSAETGEGNGWLDEFRIYNAALTTGQLWSLRRCMENEKIAVTLDPAGGTLTTTETNIVYGLAYGAVVDQIPVRDGFLFQGWKTQDGTTVTNATPVTPARATTVVTLTAGWKAIAYPVTFDFAGHGGENITCELSEGMTYAVPHPAPMEGYTFGGWTNALGATVTATTEYPSTGIRGPETLTAVWIVDTSSLWFMPGHGVLWAPVTATYGHTYGEYFPPDENCTWPGYDFAGWWTEEVGGTQVTATNIFLAMVDTTLYAHWTPVTYAVEWDANLEGATPAKQTNTVVFGMAFVPPFAPPVPPSGSCKFYGWTTERNGGGTLLANVKDGSLVWNTSVVSEAASNQTVYAQWLFRTLFNPGEGSCGQTNTYLGNGLVFGVNGALPTPDPVSGKEFVGWCIEQGNVATLISEGMSVTGAVPDTLYALYTNAAVYVWCDPNGAEGMALSLLNCRVSEPYGELPTVVWPGHVFNGWFAPGNTRVTAATLVTNAESHTLTAAWSNAVYAADFVIYGIVQSNLTMHVTYGSSFGQLPECPEGTLSNGWLFAGWRADAPTGEVVNAETKYGWSSNMIFHAAATTAVVTVTLDPAGGELADTERTRTIPFGAVYGALPRPVLNGAMFTGWRDLARGVMVTETDCVSVTTNHILTAQYAGTSFTLTFDPMSDDIGTGRFTRPVTYSGAMPSDIGVVPTRSDATFLGWYFGGTQYYDAGNQVIVSTWNHPSNGVLNARWSGNCDIFATAADLQADGRTHGECVWTANIEPGEPPHGIYETRPCSLWLRYTPSTNGFLTLSISTLPAELVFPDIDVCVYTGDKVSSLTFQCRAGETQGSMISREWKLTNLSVEEGKTYFIAVAGDKKATVLPDLNINYVATFAPGERIAHDCPCDAETLELSGSECGGETQKIDATYAGRDVEEPPHGVPGMAARHTIWFVFTAPTNGVFAACTQSALGRSVYAVTNGQASSRYRIASALYEISLAKNEISGKTTTEIYANLSRVDSLSNDPRGQESEVHVQVDEGTTYLLAVDLLDWDEENAEQKTLGIRWAFAPCLNAASPCNDHFADADLLTAPTGRVNIAYMELGTGERDEPLYTRGDGVFSLDEFATRSRWYHFTVDREGVARFDVDAGTRFCLYAGDALDGLTKLTTSGDASLTTVSSHSIHTNVNYWISADSLSPYGVGKGGFSWNFAGAVDDPLTWDGLQTSSTATQNVKAAFYFAVAETNRFNNWARTYDRKVGNLTTNMVCAFLANVNPDGEPPVITASSTDGNVFRFSFSFDIRKINGEAVLFSTDSLSEPFQKNTSDIWCIVDPNTVDVTCSEAVTQRFYRFVIREPRLEP